jgi:hypothetical protein
MSADSPTLLEAAFTEVRALEPNIMGAASGDLLYATASLARARIMKTLSFICRTE